MKRRFCGITSWVSATGENLLMTAADTRPIVLITGAVGNLGRSLGEALGRDYRIVGLDLKAEGADFPVFEADFTSDAAVELALRKFRDAFGSRIASVIHLVAYFDFTGEDHALYQTVNVEGTRRLLRALQDFEVEQFVYASTMLVHSPCRPGERIDEHQPIDARWAYPKSKAAAEVVVRAEHKRIPYVILRLAGVYDEYSMVPTMAQQMARIYDRDFQSYFYSGSTLVGQAMLHRDDMLEAFRRVVDRRDKLPPDAEMLIGEPPLEAAGRKRSARRKGWTKPLRGGNAAEMVRNDSPFPPHPIWRAGEVTQRLILTEIKGPWSNSFPPKTI